MNKEMRGEFVKFSIRLAEITFAGLVIAPTAGFLLGRELSWRVYAVAMGAGLLGILICVGIAVILARRWKD